MLADLDFIRLNHSDFELTEIFCTVGLKVGVTTPCSNYLNAAQKRDSHSALLYPAYKVVKLAAPTFQFLRLEQI